MEGITQEAADSELGEHEGPERPVLVEAAAEGKVSLEGFEAEQVDDAMDWLLASDGPSDEIAPTKLKIDVGTPASPRKIEWHLVPLPGGEFQKFRRAALGGRANRKRIQSGDIGSIDNTRYNLMVVAAATVYPDLQKAAEAKGVDVLDVLEHRFLAKPLLLTQMAGVVSDISGGDESDVEVIAGN